MPKLSQKRQITLPVADCKELGIHPGDDLEILRRGNQFNIIKKKTGSAAAMLAGSKVDERYTDAESRESSFE